MSAIGKQSVSLVIFDLDNTLWDWLGIWYASFTTLLDAVAAQSGVDPILLKRQFKAIHQKYGTAEYSYAIEELPALRAKHGDDADLREMYDGARGHARGSTPAVDAIPPSSRRSSA